MDILMKKLTNLIHKNISKGNLTTLNCPEEVYLSKELIKHHPWASWLNLQGGGTNSLAIRIARACTKENVAFCGYHGWHDWYLSANINSKNLDEHLMSGLNYEGIPDNLKIPLFHFLITILNIFQN